ncbi:hypothetical protein PVL29_009260 [Vitis rotundifolia]|uniref:TF-B3 domain-containing protein n=1 Tax=Vitis rotundifolia TaxID=103349 RepID=A0AA38ZZX2_VITRO|nr:hypothetical protein PVL29_009260 [Vitis rotundifolia]
MSEKWDSTSFPDEEADKEIKFDLSLSSGWESSVNQEVGSEEGASDDTAPATSSSHSSGASAGTSAVYNKRTLRYKKSLTRGDVTRGDLMIPIEYGRKILPEPQKRDGKYKDIEVAFMDHNRQIWPMEAYFSERRSSYMLGLNWDRYVKKFKLEPQDMIFFYHDPAIPTYDHYLMKFEKKGCDSNPTKKSSDPMEIPRRSLEIPRRSLAFPRRSPAFPRRSLAFPRRSLAIPRRRPSDPTEKPSDPTEKPGDPKDTT